MKSKKEKLFNKLKNKGIFWSYSENLKYEDLNEQLFIEFAMKFGDFEDLVFLFTEYENKLLHKIWEEKLYSDIRFRKLTYFIGRIFLNLNAKSIKIGKMKYGRIKKLQMLTATNK